MNSLRSISNPTTDHAAAARDTIAASRLAKATGDEARAAVLARQAARHVDRHLAALREARRRLP